MSSNTPQYKAFYNPTTNTYQTANGTGILNGMNSLGQQLSTQNFSDVTVRFQYGTQTVEHTFYRINYSNLSGSGGSSAQLASLREIISVSTGLYNNLVTSGPVAEAALNLKGIKTQILFSGTTGGASVLLDWAEGIGSGESLLKATVSTGINFGTDLYFGAEGASAGAALALALGATNPAILAGAAAGFLTGYALSKLTQSSISTATGGSYNDLGDFVYDEAAKNIHDYGESLGSAFNSAGKNLSEVFSWKDNNGKVQVKGSGFQATVDPVTGKMTFYTGTEQTRNDFDNAANMEKLIKSIDNSNPGLSEKVTSISLENTVTNAKKEYNRISKELENQLKDKLGNSSNLDNLTPVQQTEQAKYYSPSQLPSLTTNGREHLDYLRGDIKTKLDAANAESKLPFAQKLNQLIVKQVA